MSIRKASNSNIRDKFVKLEEFETSRNLVINGAMEIDQRNAGAAITPAVTAYTLDHWRYGNTVGANVSIQRVLDGPASYTNALVDRKYSVRLTVTTAATATGGQLAYLHQNIEGSLTDKLGWGTPWAKPLTVGFWVKSSLAGIHSFSVNKGAPSIDRSYLTTYTINQTNTWEYKTITIPGDTSGSWSTSPGTIGIELHWNTAVGPDYRNASGNTWLAGRFYSVTGVQDLTPVLGSTWQLTLVTAEIGNAATPYIPVPYTEELKRCQRYYAKTFAIETAPADFVTSTGALSIPAVASSPASAATVNWTYPVPMQRTPSISVLSAGTSSTTGVSARYWRFGAVAAANHFPRVSRIGFTTTSGDTNIVVFTSDNCADSGTIPTFSTEVSYTFDFGSPVTVTGDYYYSVFNGGTRTGAANIYYSNDNVNWIFLMSHSASNNNACGIIRNTVQTVGAAATAALRLPNNGASLSASVINVNERAVQVGNGATTAASQTRYEVHLAANAEI